MNRIIEGVSFQKFVVFHEKSGMAQAFVCVSECVCEKLLGWREVGTRMEPRTCQINQRPDSAILIHFLMRRRCSCAFLVNHPHG